MKNRAALISELGDLDIFEKYDLCYLAENLIVS